MVCNKYLSSATLAFYTKSYIFSKILIKKKKACNPGLYNEAPANGQLQASSVYQLPPAYCTEYQKVNIRDRVEIDKTEGTKERMQPINSKILIYGHMAL